MIKLHYIFFVYKSINNQSILKPHTQSNSYEAMGIGGIGASSQLPVHENTSNTQILKKELDDVKVGQCLQFHK